MGELCFEGEILLIQTDPGTTLTSTVGENIPSSIPFGVETKLFLLLSWRIEIFRIIIMCFLNHLNSDALRNTCIILHLQLRSL